MKHFRHLYIIPVLLAVLSGRALAQNAPNGATEPAGTVTGAIPQPAETGILSHYGFILQLTPQLPYTDAGAITSNSSASQVKSTYTPVDGFGRPLQSESYGYVIADGQYRDLVTLYDHRCQADKDAFLPYTVAGDGYWTTSSTGSYAAQKDYYNSRYANEGYTPYSLTKYMSDANSRKTVSYAPGKSQVGQGRGSTTQDVTNAAGEVRIWTLDANGLPVSTATYAASQLFGIKTTGPQDAYQLSLVYTDKDGRTIMKQVADSVQGTVAYYATTYYVYDEQGRPACTLSPKAVDAIAANSWVVAADVLNNLCFRYRYDSKGRQSQIRQPGEQDFTDIVYDKLDRVAMRRSALEKAQGVWEISYYDQLGRVIATSLYTNSQTRDYWQDKADNQTPANSADITWYFAGNSGEGTAPAETAVSGNTMMSYHYFDNYTIADPSNTIYNAAVAAAAPGSDQVDGNGAEAPARSLRTMGLPVYSRVRILAAPGADATKTGDWSASYLYYDDKGRAIYTCNKDLYQGTAIHTQYTGSQYDFMDRALITKHTLVNTKSVVSPAHTYTEVLQNEYDATGRLSKQRHKVDDGPWKGQANYFYNDLGQVSSKVIGDGAETQSFDYNIRGQLKSVNGYYVANGDAQTASRSFGEVLAYDYGFSQPRYDGSISGMLWRGTGTTEHAYGYGYDEDGRLKAANYTERYEANATEGTWGNTAADYTLTGVSYDRNGNITALKQRGMGLVNTGGTPVIQPVDMDQLTYTYEANSNRLMKVADAVNPHTSYDFKDGANTGNDYAYDAAGNLAQDLNKGISAITYTWFNKPQVITYANGNKILYSYDAAGRKVQEKITESGITKVSAYIGNFVYQNDSLQYMLTPEGRTVFDLANSSNTEQFFVKDHLGNVRSVVETTPMPLLPYLATYELAAANTESLLFDKVGEIRTDKPGGGGDDTEAGKLDGSVDSLITGTSLLLQVMAGDEVEMQVDNYYDNYDPHGDIPLQVSDIMHDLVTSLADGISSIGQREGISGTTISSMLLSSGNINSLTHVMDSITDPTRPSAYLTYMQFDQSMKLVQGGSGAYQVTGDGSWTIIGTNGQPVKILEDGYIIVTIHDRSERPVWFDRLQVLFHRGKLKEEDHYYPYGLPMANIGSTAAGMMPNRRKYQGNEFITEAGLNWMSFGARQYDPQIGRFLSIDPLASAGGQDRFSPFAAMGDAPAGNVDPNGMQYLTTRGIGGMPDETSLAMAWNLNHMKQSQAGTNFGWGNDTWDALSWGGGGGAMTLQQTVMQTENTIAFYSMVLGSRSGDTYDGEGSFVGNFQPEIRMYAGAMNRAGNFLYDQNIQGGQESNNNGITVRVCRLLTPNDKLQYGIGDGNNGVFVVVAYDPPADSKYSDFQWIQTVSTNSLLITGCESPLVDGDADGKGFPFYRPKEYNDQHMMNIDGHYFTFFDAPNRPLFSKSQNVTWTAELSLVGRTNGGSYVNLATMTYGFSFTNGIVYLQNLSFLTTPSPFLQGILNCLP